MSALDPLLDRLPRIVLVAGKGGVGKTTFAVGLGAAFARRGEKTLVVSTDPAAALGDVIGAPVGDVARSVRGAPRLQARQLDSTELRREFLARWRAVIAEIVDRGTYLARAEVDGLVDAALPGADEIFALLALADLIVNQDGPARIVVDTAPTGHTLRLLALPDTFRALLDVLDTMQDKHRFVVSALTHRYKRDAADAFIDEMRSRVDALKRALADHGSVAAVVITRAEPVVALETERYVDALRALGVGVAALVVNAAAADGDPLGGFRSIDTTIPRWVVPRRATPPRGVADVSATIAQSATTAPRRPARRRAAKASPRPARGLELASLVRPLTIVGGKGGVGKSTVSCALAIAAADAEGGPVLLVSTDPAPSIADALGDSDQLRWREERRVTGVKGLSARQLDASAAFAASRDRYQSQIDSMFGAVVARGADAARDRAVMRDLLALAPPGVDELFALSLLGDELAAGRFTRIVVDPAPTGHLLRLLEMPATALDWSHRLMRLMLEYRDVVGLGDAAAELLEFSKRTRALDALLRDPARAGVMLVTLDEPVVRAQTRRLARSVRQRDCDVIALVWNRSRRAVDPLPQFVAARQVCAAETRPPPVGVAALRRWSRSWREVRSTG
ncbi:MAG TPA: ArsA family ATPase [Gemmatimonadaceae bacterium]|nr:ArsA family ATPase [Gemmatimonadaceae bacterium]